MKSQLSDKLAHGLTGLKQFAPFSTSPRLPRFEQAIDDLTDVCSALELLDGMWPGYLDQLVSDAFVELQASQKPIPQIQALISRYTTSRRRA